MTRILSSLRIRLMFLVLLAMIPALALVTYTASEQRRIASIQTQADALRLAKTAAANHEQLIDAAQQLLTIFAQFPAVRDRDPASCQSFFDALKDQVPPFSAYGVTDRTGNLVCSTLPANSAKNIGDDSFIPSVLATQRFRAGEYRVDSVSGKTSFGFGYPLIDGQKQVQGVVFAAVSVSTLNQMAARSLLPPGSTLSIRDRNGTIVARYPDPDQWVGRAAPEWQAGAVHSLRQGEGTLEARGLDNVPRLYAFAPLRGVPENDLSVSVGIPSEVVYAAVNQALQRNLIALGAVTLLSLIAAWFGAEWFLLRQLNTLLSVTKRLATGDLHARTGLPHGSGELGELARAFDQMALALDQRDAERKQDELIRAGLLHQVITAQEDERLRIARELHDETSQSLATLMLGLENATLSLEKDVHKTGGYLRTTKYVAEAMIEDIHRLIEDLRPTLLDLLGLEAAIIWYGEQRLSPQGITLHLDKDGLTGRLPAPMETVLFRIAQEALTNVVRHARATTVNVRLANEAGCFLLQVTDNGQGFDPALDSIGKSFGLRGMQERISILRGEFRLQTAPGQGTVIKVRAPMPKEEPVHG